MIGVLSLLITGATLSGFALALYWLRLETGQAITVAFVTLALAQLWNVFNVRGGSGRQLVNDVTGNPYIWAALALCAGLVALALWLPSLSALLDLPDPGLPGLGLAAALSLVPLIAGQILLLFNLTPGHDREQGTQPSGRASLRGRDVERG